MKPFTLLKASAPLILPVLSSVTVFYIPAFAGGETPHWSYGGATNPTHWGELSEIFALCEIGRDQSPIDIDTDKATAGSPSDLEFNYNTVPLEVVNNGHTIQANYPEGSIVSIDGDEYELLQFHFHTPSEHTVSGRAAAMEMHLVHKNAAGELAVIGIMIAAGVGHSSLETVWQHIPDGDGVNAVAGATINAADFLPSDLSYYSYGGSLTTPPCSEGVRWHVLAEPIQASEAQIATFESLYQVNARPVQPTNGRIVEHHE